MSKYQHVTAVDNGDNHDIKQQIPIAQPVNSNNDPTSSQQQTVTIHLSNMQTGKITNIRCNTDTTIKQLKLQYYNNEIDNNKLIRFIYLGRILSDNQTIQQCNVQNDHHIHVIIVDKPVGYSDDGINNNNDITPQQHHYQQQQQELYRQQLQQQPVYIPQHHTIYVHNNDIDDNIQVIDYANNDIQQQQYNNIGSNSEMILGFIMGFVLGPLSIFCMLHV